MDRSGDQVRPVSTPDPVRARRRGRPVGVSPERVLARRYQVLTGLRWLPVGIIIPVGVLLLRARGLDLVTIGALAAMQSAVVALLELPTGGLADVVGRRAVLVGAGCCLVAAVSLTAVAHDVAWFAAASLAAAAGRALGSGPLDAWFVDALADLRAGARGPSDLAPPATSATPRAGTGRDGRDALTSGLAGGQAGEAIGLCVGVLGGAALSLASWGLPADGTALLVRFSVPQLVAAALFLVWTVLVALLVRPVSPPDSSPPESPAGSPPASTSTPTSTRTSAGTGSGSGPSWSSVLASVPTTVRRGLQISARHPDIRRLLARTFTIGIALVGLELFVPVLLSGLAGSASGGAGLYGVLAATGFLMTALGAGVAPALARRLGSTRQATTLATAVTAVAILGLMVPSVAVLSVTYLACYALLGLSGPLASTLLHRRIEGRDRTTVLSIESLALQAGGLTAGLILPRLAARSDRLVWLACGLVLALGALAVERVGGSRPGSTPERIEE